MALGSGDGRGVKGRFPFGSRSNHRTTQEEFYKAVPLDDNGDPDEVSGVDKAKGVAQMAAGTAIAAAGVPMLILPGPGVAAVAGGAALALKGHRVMTGRDPYPIEQTIDDAASHLATKAKEEAALVGRKVAHKATDVGSRLVEEGPSGVVDFAKRAPERVSSVASHAPELVSTVARQAPEVVEVVGRAASRGAKVVSGIGSEVLRQGANVVKDRYTKIDKN